MSGSGGPDPTVSAPGGRGGRGDLRRMETGGNTVVVLEVA